MNESDFYLAFSCAPGVGPKRFQSLLTQFETAQNVWEILGSDKDIKVNDIRIGATALDLFSDFKRTFSIEQYKERLFKMNVTFIPQCSSSYPHELMMLPNPPIGLFVKGTAKLLQNKKFGIVGTRKVTSYGKDVTQMLASELVRYGYTIVSGLALGVDAIAHRAALEAKGYTIAVLGCGVDCCNPAENRRLYDEMIEKGSLILSEYPLGMMPTKGSFPARNRIIAALSQGLLVTEAGADSGSLITAKDAKNLGKYIFAVPGPITSKQSDGTSYLLRTGAHLVQSAQNIVKVLGGDSNSILPKIDIETIAVSDDEKILLRLIQEEEKSFDELLRKSSFDAQGLGMLLGNLELSGFISQNSNGLYFFIRT